MPLTACRHIRRMRGGAQAHLLEADDGQYYVVKFLNNPQHRRIVINELLASALLKYLQISSPEAALVHVTEEFLAQNPETYISLGPQRIAVVPGWHFGSRYPGDPARVPVYDYVPDALLTKVSNLSEFLGVLVFDKWAANADGRQSIFFRARVQQWSNSGAALPQRTEFVALMIDHGFVFNGPNWDFTESPSMGLYSRKMVYQSVSSVQQFQPWLDQVVHFPEEMIDAAYKQIPASWMDGEEQELEAVLEKLLERRRQVPELIYNVRKAKVNPFPNWR